MIVSRDELMRLPDGTIYAPYTDGIVHPVCVKGSAQYLMSTLLWERYYVHDNHPAPKLDAERQPPRDADEP